MKQALVQGHGSPQIFLRPIILAFHTKLDLTWERALVLWGAQNNTAALAAPSPVLAVGQQQLAHFCHAPGQRAALALPGCDVAFVRGRITGNQVLSQWPRYINVILIQS